MTNYTIRKLRGFVGFDYCVVHAASNTGIYSTDDFAEAERVCSEVNANSPRICSDCGTPLIYRETKCRECNQTDQSTGADRPTPERGE